MRKWRKKRYCPPSDISVTSLPRWKSSAGGTPKKDPCRTVSFSSKIHFQMETRVNVAWRKLEWCCSSNFFTDWFSASRRCDVSVEISRRASLVYANLKHHPCSLSKLPHPVCVAYAQRVCASHVCSRHIHSMNIHVVTPPLSALLATLCLPCNETRTHRQRVMRSKDFVILASRTRTNFYKYSNRDGILL